MTNIDVKTATGTTQTVNYVAPGVAGTASTDVITVQGAASMTALAVSASALPLPSGAATSAKQPALGTAGTASTDVLTVQGAASMSPLYCVGFTKKITPGITRPANTTAYSAGQCISDNSGNPLYISTIGRVNAGTGIIVKAALYISSNPSTKPDIDLLIFDTQLNMGADQSACAITTTQLQTILGTVSFVDTTAKIINGLTYYEVQGLTIPFICASGSQNLYGYLLTRSAWTPDVNSNVLKVILGVIQD